MTTSPVRAINAQLILLGDVHRRPLLEAILDRFEAQPLLRPSHWGVNGSRDPYSRGAIVAAVENAGEKGIVPRLLRATSPGDYVAEWYGGEQNLTASLHVDSLGGRVSLADAPLYFQAVGGLAGGLQLDWGHIDVSFEGQDKAADMLPGSSSEHLGSYARFGPVALFPRNFFGPRLVELAEGGETAIRATGLPVVKLPNGVLQLDLLPEPWMADAATLKEAQQRAHELLRPLGIFARPKTKWNYLPGLFWQSPVPPAKNAGPSNN